VHKVLLFRINTLSTDLLARTVKLAQFKGRRVRGYELKLNPTRSEFNRYYHDELNYIKSFATHRYKALTEEIGNIKGMIQALDITALLPSSMLNQK